ncbi:MAG: molybdate ABC transporter permease subunit [SAR324 cluster bacterium]|nr:molybdate ABC transporter permease subunit [SAR324 cluster bacterium]
MSEYWQFTAMEKEALWLSLKVACWCVLVSLPFGIACSWVLVRCQFYGKIILEMLVHLPLVMPPIATGYALLVLFGKQGFFGYWLDELLGISFAFSWKGAVLASMIVSFPLLVRALTISLESLDLGLEEVAKTLGASSFRVFFTITLPLIVPGILSGMMLTFARSLGEFGATITFVSNIQGETMTLPLAMFNLIQQPNTENATLRLFVLSVVLAVTALFASEQLNRWIQKNRAV